MMTFAGLLLRHSTTKAVAFLLLLLATHLPTTVRSHQVIRQVHGSGTTNPSKCYWAIMEQLAAKAKVPVRLTYRAVGSTTGKEEFLENQADFGSGDMPLDAAGYQQVQADGGMVHLPVLLGAVSFFHSVPDTPDLNLTACLLGRIFTREITSWSHDDIRAMNPNLALSGRQDLPIRVARRVKGSSSTDSITKYLYNACPDHFPEELSTKNPPDWPADTEECQGSSGMTACILEEPGTIGYIDAGHGHSAGLQEIELQNLEGTLLNSKQAAEKGGIAAAESGVLPDQADADHSAVSLLNRPGEYTWPIVQMTYLYVRKNLSFIDDPIEQTLLVAFLKALYDIDYVEQCRDEYGFTLPSTSVVDFAEQGIAMLQFSNATGNATEWFFEKNTTSGQGAGDFVFSDKRKLISDLERDALAKTTDELEARIEKLERQLDRMQAVTGIQEGDEEIMAGAGQGDFTEQDETQLKAALVLSSLSFAFCVIFMFVSCFRYIKKP